MTPEELLDEVSRLDLTQLRAALRMLRSYRDAFQHLVGVKPGDRCALTKSLNGEEHGAWAGRPCLSAGMIGTVREVQWDQTRHYAYALWAPDYETGPRPEASPRSPKGVAPWPPSWWFSTAKSYPRQPPTDPRERLLYETIEAELAAWKTAHGGEVPHLYSADPVESHVFAIKVDELRPATADEIARAACQKVRCLACRTETLIADLPWLRYRSTQEETSDWRDLSPAEAAEWKGPLYRPCPACRERRALALLDPLWEK